MLCKRIGLGVAIVASLSTSGLAAGSKLTLRDRQRAACFNDVQTLCGIFLPDQDTTAACMATKRAQISPGCAKYYNTETPPK